MTMPRITSYRAVPQMSEETAAAYKNVHDRLTAISRSARAEQCSRFESVNREIYTEARSHLNAIENAEGDDLITALLAAGSWLSKH